MTNMNNKGILKNGEHTPITTINNFENYAYWKNGTSFIYDTVLDEDLSNLFSCYNIDWLVSDSGWTLRDNHENKIYTFTAEA